MSAGKNPDPGYRLPDVVDPEDSVCIRAYVPNADEYIAAFWQSYEFLTKWLAWERDDGHSGALAAAAWLPRFLRAREEWLCGGGECGLMDVRQKPGEPCTLQKQLCCDGEWVDFATISLCTTEPEPYQEDALDEIADIMYSWLAIIQQIDDYLDDGKTPSEIKILMSGISAYFPGLSAVIDAMAPVSSEDRQDAIDAMAWQDMYYAIWCTGDDCGIQAEGWLDDIGDWALCLLDVTLDWIDEQSDEMSGWIGGMLDGIADETGIIAIANLWPDGGTNLSLYEPVCTWEHIFDFTVSNGAWEQTTLLGAGWGSGYWDSGGWHTQDGTPDFDRRFIGIQRLFDDVEITSIKVTFDIVWGNWTTGNAWYIRMWQDSSYITENGYPYQFVADGSDRELLLERTATADAIDIFASTSKGDWSGSLTITKITLTGTGSNPFV